MLQLAGQQDARHAGCGLGLLDLGAQLLDARFELVARHEHGRVEHGEQMPEVVAGLRVGEAIRCVSLSETGAGEHAAQDFQYHGEAVAFVGADDRAGEEIAAQGTAGRRFAAAALSCGWVAISDMSSTIGAPWRRGMATAKGLLPSAGVSPPQGGRPIFSSVLVPTNPRKPSDNARMA